MHSQPPNLSSSLLLRLAFYGLCITMALVHVFITFRGLSSADGMEQAQLARELARGNFFQTKVIRPYAWAALNEAGKDPSPAAMPDITQPPLQALVWAPVFSLLHRHHIYEPLKNGAIYMLDRAIACMGVTGLLLTLLWAHGAARRLFDEIVAGVAVTALLGCEPLWELSVSGSPLALLLPLFALAFRVYISALLAAGEGRGIGLRLVALGGLAALMVLTQWMAVWLVLGIVLAVVIGFPGKRAGAALVAALPLIALCGWGWWTVQRCGDPLGGAKTVFQAHLLALDPSLLQRDFSVITQPVQLADLLRKVATNLQAQLAELFAHAGWLAPALFFFPALLHRFRLAAPAAARLGLGVMIFTTAIGMVLLGLPEHARDDNALYLVLAPAMTVFGTAMLAVLWARLQPAGGHLWQRLGYAFIAIALTAVPLAALLPVQVKLGLTLRNRLFPHWPPYVPDRVSLVRKLIEKEEMVFSDVPWFVAWYADIPTAWIPVKRSDFTAMRDRAKAHSISVAGFIISPLSARVSYLHEAFTGAYREWPDLIFRGPMLAFDREFLPRPDFEYKVPMPLVAVPVGARENLSLQMTFYTDRLRTVKE